MRSPFLQTIYFEYYVSSTTKQQKYKRTTTARRSKEENFSVSTRGSGIDHNSAWGYVDED